MSGHIEEIPLDLEEVHGRFFEWAESTEKVKVQRFKHIGSEVTKDLTECKTSTNAAVRTTFAPSAMKNSPPLSLAGLKQTKAPKLQK
eukprot:766305-Hanusia_phi.AAC.4